MTARAADIGQAYEMQAAQRDRIHMLAIVDVGATGAPTTDPDDAGITVARTAAGNYDITFPLMARGTLKVNMLVGTTAFMWRCETFNAVAGTAHIAFINAAGTDVELASGDKFSLEIIADRQK